MNYTNVVQMLDAAKVDYKLVNETLYVYTDDYTNSQHKLGKYLDLGWFHEDEEGFYDEFVFSDNFTAEPEYLMAWVRKFTSTGKAPGYDMSQYE